MYILENVPLSTYSTMRLGGTAAWLTEVQNRNDINQAVAWAKARNLPFITIGTGSNVVWQDDGYPGLVIINRIGGIDVDDSDSSFRYVTAGAGVVWDELVAHTVAGGMSGLENLSLIPGTVGATPVQNVGAYGSEVSSVILTIEAYDTTTSQFVVLRAGDCEFGYRTSRFKTTDKGRFIISSVTFFLNLSPPTPPYYTAVEDYLKQNNITTPSVNDIRTAVIAIRSAKLPDPATYPNNGSFFANPIISDDQLRELADNYPEIVYWNVDGQTSKLSAAWLIDQAGFKDFHDTETGMSTWHLQPLVLVNEHAETSTQLIVFRDKIIAAVENKFGVRLEQEPELI